MRYGYLRPRTIEEALEAHGRIPGGRFIAGGTDLMVQMRHGALRPEALISLRSVRGLSGIELGERLSIGAGTLLADIARDPGIRARCPILAQAAQSVGSVQIRNVATIGGNLCNASPCANSAPPLVVLDAALRIAGPSGTRELPIAELFTGPGATRLQPGEILTRIDVRLPPLEARAVFFKKGRVFVDLALVSLGVILELEADGLTCRQARVAAGAVGPTPLRLRRVEEALAGQRLEPEAVGRAVELLRADIRPISDVRASADYRRHLSGVLLERAVARILEGGRAP